MVALCRPVTKLDILMFMFFLNILCMHVLCISEKKNICNFLEPLWFLQTKSVLSERSELNFYVQFIFRLAAITRGLFRFSPCKICGGQKKQW
jgi:ABC-type uncharacterized transport system permease subunit